MNPVVRFAPSPTGNIHIGNARTALINWIFAKKHGGKFILRFDDTDLARSRSEYADNIAKDLKWLSILPDRIERQSQRMDSYREITDQLISRGKLYPCYETPDELDRKRKRLAARGLPPIYDRAAMKLSDEEKAALEQAGRKPHWRFLLPNYANNPFELQKTETGWRDLVRGQQTVDLASLSDPVLVREDGSWLYTLPSIVDDMEMGVTHIIRGDDHVTNTGVQIAIFETLGHQPPQFGHHNLLTTASGEGLSKRLGSLSLHSLAGDCYEPMAVASLAVLIGGAGSVEPIPDMQSLIERFEIGNISMSPAKFDLSELDSLNRKLVHAMSWNAVSHRFDDHAFDGRGEEFWNVIRENITRVCEAEDWWNNLINAEPVITPENREFVSLAQDLLPPEPWDVNTWPVWTAALKEKTGRKGRTLFMPLRLAITGMDKGPDMAALLPLIGREKTLARLS
jgi:glutamyl-tRNA synthetase